MSVLKFIRESAQASIQALVRRLCRQCELIGGRSFFHIGFAEDEHSNWLKKPRADQMRFCSENSHLGTRIFFGSLSRHHRYFCMCC